MTRVLVVEDNPDDVNFLRAAVAAEPNHDFDLVHAQSLEEAESTLAHQEIALIVLDLCLPDADGLEAIQRLSSLPAAVPIIVWTGRYGTDLGTEVLRLGADDYLLKDSLDGDSLRRSFRHALERHRLTRQLADEVHVTTALARSGQRLMTGRSTNEVLAILCRIGREILGADTARVLWCESDPPRLTEMISEPAGRPPQSLGKEQTAALLSALQQQVLFLPRASPLRSGHADTFSYVALRRGGALIAVLELGHGNGDGVETGPRRRILQGLNQLATLALENVRVLEELSAANRTRSDLDAMMSHELRNALNIVIGSTDVALSESSDDWPGREFLELARRRAAESLDLIRATLELSRSDSSQATVAVEPVDLAEVFGELDRELRMTAHADGATLRWQIAP
ncbi:MAG TPA: response regulator, partial [Terriglobales bacterium]|nr:response regulator [Terriglobales bacterium]